MTDLKQDEYGYINGRGASSYWGVTTSMVSGKRTWVITFRPSWADKTLGLRSEGGNIQERDAATVAAWLYENMDDGSLKDVTIRVRSRLNPRRVLCFVPSQGQIWIEAFKNQTLNQLRSDLTLDEIVSTVESLDDPVGQAVLDLVQSEDEQQAEEAFEESEEKVKSLCERNLIAMVQNAILEDNISPRAAKLMIASLETVLD